MKKLIFVACAFFMSFVQGQVAAQEPSLFDYQTVWRNQNDQEIKFKDFEGDVYLLSMAYTACTHTCPLIISKIEDIKKSLAKAGHKRVKVVLASFDDVTDKPKQLKSYMKKRGLDEAGWTFLSPASQKEVRELAVLLGISFKKLKGGDYSHANVISLVDAKGRIIARMESLSGDIGLFQEALKKQ